MPLLRSPEVMNRARAMGDYLRFNSVLPPRLSEFAILITARDGRSTTSGTPITSLALEGGLSPDIAQALAEGRRPERMADDEAIIYNFCTELQQHQERQRRHLRSARSRRSANRASSTSIGISGLLHAAGDGDEHGAHAAAGRPARPRSRRSPAMTRPSPPLPRRRRRQRGASLIRTGRTSLRGAVFCIAMHVMNSPRLLPALLLLLRRQRLRRPHLRSRLVPAAGAGHRLVGRLDGRAARHVHGRHVPRQPAAAALLVAACASAPGLRLARARHRRCSACSCCSDAARRRRLHGLGRHRGRRHPAARRRRGDLPAAADAADGRDAAGHRALGRSLARRASPGSASSTAATPPARCSAACSPASTCCACIDIAIATFVAVALNVVVALVALAVAAHGALRGARRSTSRAPTAARGAAIAGRCTWPSACRA